jgi:hypothetical protein
MVPSSALSETVLAETGCGYRVAGIREVQISLPDLIPT